MTGYLGRELAAARECAEATAARIDKEVGLIIMAARDRATAIIRRARPALDALTDELVAHKMGDSSSVPPPASRTGSGPCGPTGT